MTDEDRNALVPYCPEIVPLHNGVCGLLSTTERDILIAAALRREIIKRGKWVTFFQFAEGMEDVPINRYSFTAWLTDAETFCRVAGQALEAGVIGKGGCYGTQGN